MNTAIAIRLLREFWLANWPAVFWAVAVVLCLSSVTWFLLEAAWRAKILSSPPQLRRGKPRPRSASPAGRSLNEGLGWGGAVQENGSIGQHHPGASIDASPYRARPSGRHPSSTEEGRFSTFLLSNILKSLFILAAGLALAAICFGRYFITSIAEWPHLWPDTRGAALVVIVTLAAMGFVLTIFDTLVRSNAVELLGTDLFRVTGLIGILLLVEMMTGTACVVMLGAGWLNVTSLSSALAMLGAMAFAVAFLNVLHSYLLLVRYSAVGIMRQNVIEI